MSYPARPNAQQVGALIGAALDPVMRKRGLTSVDLLRWWPDIVGASNAALTRPERIRWPRGAGPAVLFIRADPAVALPLSYEREQIRERLNGFFGYPAVGEVRIVRHPVAAPGGEGKPEPAPDPRAMAALELRLAATAPALRESLLSFGRAVLARS